MNLKMSHLLKAALRFGAERTYLAAALVFLLGSTVLWSYLGARLQMANADQLVSGYLFQSGTDLHNALLPAAHTFLIKWPLFMLLKVLGVSYGSFVFATVLTALGTVAIFAVILYLITPRPVVLGTIYLALASCLLLVPAVPAAGSLLPVNMAMLTTRNIEYVLYILALTLLIRSFRFRNWQFWIGVVLLAVVMASDKLFLYMSLGASLMALIVYSLSSGWNLVSLSARWLVGSIAAAAGAVALLSSVSVHRTVHIINNSSAGPYGLIHSVHQLGLGLPYAVVALATNFGANPAFTTTLFRQMPAQSTHNLLIFGFVAFFVNGLVLLIGLYASVRLVKASFYHNNNRDTTLEYSQRLALALIFSSLAALILFVATQHYYAADARYLSISIFAVFTVLASAAANPTLPVRKLILAGEIMMFGIILSLPAVIHTYNKNQTVLDAVDQRNYPVLQALSHHNSNYLVGDYWRVLPIKFESENSQQIVPLENCTEMRQVLTSKSWRPDLHKTSFTYLLSTDRSLTDYPHCTLSEVVRAYGRPNGSLVTLGDFAKPREMLLFYDHGINKSAPVTPPPASGPATVVPASLSDLPHTYCSVPTIMNIVAHQDDDLLFMNPDTYHDIKAGHCVRTIYLTAGDAGQGSFYWISRQQGAEAAYASMLGVDDIWVERIIKIADNQYVTVANPRGNDHISLIFMYLPDGNLKGSGFNTTGDQSLAKLENNQIKSLEAVYTASVYTTAQLEGVLTTLMHTYQPSEIRTQSSYNGRHFPDHSDHMAVGRFVTKAYQDYDAQQYENKVVVPLTFYIGYPVHEMPENVSGDDLAVKTAAFLAYSKYDGGVCHSLEECNKTPTYNAYLKHQYTYNF